MTALLDIALTSAGFVLGGFVAAILSLVLVSLRLAEWRERSKLAEQVRRSSWL